MAFSALKKLHSNEFYTGVMIFLQHTLRISVVGYQDINKLHQFNVGDVEKQKQVSVPCIFDVFSDNSLEGS